MRPVHFAYILSLTAAILWCALLFAAPWCVHTGGSWTEAGQTIYEGFHRICHQMDDRSMHAFGLPLAACSRCSAIYFAFLVGMVVYPFVKPLRTPCAPSRATLALALAPMLIDVALSAAGILQSGMTSRLITGIWFGLMLPFVVLPVYLGAVLEHSASPSTTVLTNMKGRVDA
jgi:uncharacterized membrane protein